ncbi:hypothetical protein LR48_Vigan03g144000 [Vigna angularis]|uniref:Uncharacterized protein n=1 Tax=Phaseolus angularis TaxID=3914 RepID=A0A0L9U5F7_PHAAN|nr:hypothetical protein LR48_Vigan03g144000 [Vigna angularis]
MVGEGIKRPQISLPILQPPRTINVQKYAESRALELHSLQSIIENRVNNDYRSQRNKRRRTTAFNNQIARKGCRRKRQKVGIVGKAFAKSGLVEDELKKLPRRVRRRYELKNNPENGFRTSGDGTKRLRTHVWHAKRFAMTKLWGYHLPLCLQGRGKGSRALLKRLREGVLVHDASYYTALQLEGPEDSLISVLRSILEPSPTSTHPDSLISGVTYGSAMLRQDGGLICPPIAPVTYMWQPTSQQNISTQLDEQNHYTSFGQHDIGNDSNKHSVELCEKPDKVKHGSSFRHLWVWIHASAFEEGFDNLKTACRKEDPRELPWKRNVVPVEHISTKTLSDASETKCKELAELGGILEENKDLSSLSWSKLEVCQCNVDDLWYATTRGLRPPVEDNVLSKEKHHERMINFCLVDTDSGHGSSSTKVQSSRSCPILLLKNDVKELSIGWSVILPLSWVKAFWIPLISNGAHAIGLQEKHWITCEMGLPVFPSDFPDCKAYSCLMEDKEAAFNKKEELRPPSIRHLRVPIQPPWGIVRVTFDKMISSMKTPDLSTREDLTNSNSLPNLYPGSFKISNSDSWSNSFDGTVVRTGSMLTTFLHETKVGQLLLFPYATDGEARISKFINGELKLDPSSERNEEGLQMSQSAMRLYFKEHSSGRWEMQIPDDSIASKSHRWPIGFVTTGSVQGSKSLVAEGFCEAVLLSHLREEQWKEMPMKKRREIYVLVRNLRSTAYRLALASIILEYKENDIEFL